MEGDASMTRRREEEGGARELVIPTHPHERSMVPMHPQITKGLLCLPLQQRRPRAYFRGGGYSGNLLGSAPCYRI